MWGPFQPAHCAEGRAMLVQVKLVDFGMASLSRECRGVCGKRSYVAPEQYLNGEHDGFLSDSFALGVCLFSLATQARESLACHAPLVAHMPRLLATFSALTRACKGQSEHVGRTRADASVRHRQEVRPWQASSAYPCLSAHLCLYVALSVHLFGRPT